MPVTAPHVLKSPWVRAGLAAGLLLLCMHALLATSSRVYNDTLDAARTRIASKLGRNNNGTRVAHGQTWFKGHRKPDGYTATDWDLDLANAQLETEVVTNNNATRVNAAFVVLARNSDLWDLLQSIRQVEGEQAVGTLTAARQTSRKQDGHVLNCARTPRPLQ